MTRSIRFACFLGFFALFVTGEASALCVTSSEANLRNGPGTRYSVNWRVFTNMPLRKLAQRGNWYKVQDVDGDKHWIHRNLVSNRLHCGVVKADRARVRTGPGKRYGQLDWSPARKYYAFQVLYQSGQWTKIRDEYGDMGWIARSLTWQQ